VRVFAPLVCDCEWVTKARLSKRFVASSAKEVAEPYARVRDTIRISSFIAQSRSCEAFQGVFSISFNINLVTIYLFLYQMC
jgi:hypothetical protein